MLCLGSFFTNYYITAEVLLCYGSPECFDSSLQLIWIVGLGVFYLPLDNTPRVFYGVQVRRVGWPFRYSNVMVSKQVSSLATVGRFKVLLKKEIKLISRHERGVL